MAIQSKSRYLKKHSKKDVHQQCEKYHKLYQLRLGSCRSFCKKLRRRKNSQLSKQAVIYILLNI